MRPRGRMLAATLEQIQEVMVWPVGAWDLWGDVYSRAAELFDSSPGRLVYRTQAMVLEIMADALERVAAQPRPAAPDHDQLAPAVALMDERYRENPSLEEVAAAAHLSASHFHARFREALGMTPHAYMQRRRLQLARCLLAETDMAVGEVGREAGYESPYYFSRVFRKTFGVSPTEERRLARREGP
ncbi:MAG: AraC family transcriptional regulator [Phycisphaeraceae bacterium]|nr:AraC family transcriptional regulator [Phycisphaeraceae bacterium]